MKDDGEGGFYLDVEDDAARERNRQQCSVRRRNYVRTGTGCAASCD